MKKYIKYIVIAIMVLSIMAGIIVAYTRKNKEIKEDDNFKIVTSFYPIYVMTANIVDGAKNVTLDNMTEANTGCVHNYTLTTSDMKKIEKANVFIENGLGLEDSFNKIVESKPNLEIIDSSSQMSDLIEDEDEDETNPHIWTSISKNIQQVKNITNALKEKNPENADIYEKNCNKYVEKLENLKKEYEEELDLKGEKAVTLNENFAYFAKEIGLNLKLIHTSHEETALSGETLKNVIDEMKSSNGKIILVDIDEDTRTAKTISKETGANIFVLDSATTGSLDKDAYINAMKQNLKILKAK